MAKCHCGKDGHPLHSVNCPACSYALVDRVALAINEAWSIQGDVPFPLYQHEAEELAKAAIKAVHGQGD
jgi:hypothetical protein